MKTMMRCLVVVLGLITVTDAQWVKTGLPNKNVTSFVVSGNYLFAGSDSGVYRSTDNGVSWVIAGLTNKSIYSLTVHGANLFACIGNKIPSVWAYAQDAEGIYTSTDNGINWTAINNGLPKSIQYPNLFSGITSLLPYGGKLFAGTTRGLYTSSNNGASWNADTTFKGRIIQLFVSGAKLFLSMASGASAAGFCSKDSGVSWKKVNGLTSSYIFSFGINENNIFALAASSFELGVDIECILYSTDYGDNWLKTYSTHQPGIVYMGFTTLAVTKNETGNAKLFAGIFDGGDKELCRIGVSANDGMSWTAVDSGLQVFYINTLLVHGNYLFAGTDSGVWRRLLSEMNPSPSSDSLLVPVAGGTFTAGTTPVTISSFKMDKYEVTFELWTEVRTWALTHGYTDLVAGMNGYNPVGANNPVDSVNWYDVVKWCNARSEKDGLTPVYYSRSAQDTVYRTGDLNINVDAVKWTANGYRLPTEAEWEFAAKGGSQSKGFTFSGSNTIGDVAWYGTNSGGATHIVGTKQPNELGIYDMSGNVFEWCWDWFSMEYPSGLTDPKGPSTTQSYRLYRGGNFGVRDFVIIFSVGFRLSSNPTNRDNVSGFRCVQGSQVGTAVKSEIRKPQTFEMTQNYPNPFNPSTTIRYSLPSMANVKLAVYDLLGREIATLVNEEQSEGWKEVQWNASGFSSGIYFYQLQTNGKREIRKMILMK